jgi:hypothetical protein
MNLQTAAQNALTVLRHVHGAHIGICPGPDHCPTASAIHDLESALLDGKIEAIRDEIARDMIPGPASPKAGRS